MRQGRTLVCVPLFLVALASAPIARAEPFDGILVARQDCPATVSTKRADNPGDLRLQPGESYPVVARNKTAATHFLLRIDGADPKERWVRADCGELEPSARTVPEAADTAAMPARAAGRPPSMAGQTVLAASWQPAFCERRRDKPECRNQTPDRPDARRFSLHGLWPQPIGNDYCGVGARERAIAEARDWRRLPAPSVDGPTRLALAERMPGVVSHLDRHEWIKHGTCYGTDADTYFDHAMALLDQLNASEVRRLFELGTGKRLRAEEIRAAFDRAFGPGAGERVRVECDEDGLISELRIGLKGAVDDSSRLADLIRAAPTRTVGCRGGWVDRAGPGR